MKNTKDQKANSTTGFSYKYQKPSYQIPRKDWVHRNPRLFQIVAITTCLSIFFSRQIYDIFIRKDEDFFDLSTRPPPNRR